jgi:hypothetical protein
MPCGEAQCFTEFLFIPQKLSILLKSVYIDILLNT